MTYPFGQDPESLAVGDFDGDGLPDLVSANRNNNTVSLLFDHLTQSAAALEKVAVYGGGMHGVTAGYAGDTSQASSASSAINLQGTPIPTALTLVVQPSAGVQARQPVQLSATVQPPSAYNYGATGTVSFYDNANLLGSTVLSAAGTATLNSTALPAGTDTLTAVYSGDTNFAGSSASSQLTVLPAPSFTITSNPSSETTWQDWHGDWLGGVVLTLQALNGFHGNVQLSCAGGPAGTQCKDLPKKVSLSGTAYALSGVLFPAQTPSGTYSVTFTGVLGSVTSSVR
ncbi:MAG: Ig-like domain repeat protein [Acidobacteriota bacterium]|nr:Ig-like domain repeat protein [Acidobacteriota bacterium]